MKHKKKQNKKKAKEKGLLGWEDMVAWRDSDLRRDYLESLYQIRDI
jgi:hypothetical protein